MKSVLFTGVLFIFFAASCHNPNGNTKTQDEPADSTVVKAAGSAKKYCFFWQ